MYQQPVSSLSVEEIFRDSHALLSVPSKPWSEDVLDDGTRRDSMTQSLGNGDQEELKEIEQALVELRHVTEDPTQLRDILANDVFSYVEDALLRESDGLCLSKSGDVEVNRHKGYAQHQDCLLPSNQVMKCQGSGSPKLTDVRTIYYGQNTADGMERNEPQRVSHNNHSFSVQETQFTDDSSQNTQHHLHHDVPGQPFFINNPDAVQRGVSQSWQQQHHVVPLTLPSAPQRSDCITQNPSVTQHPQDSHTQAYGGLCHQ